MVSRPSPAAQPPLSALPATGGRAGALREPQRLHPSPSRPPRGSSPSLGPVLPPERSRRPGCDPTATEPPPPPHPRRRCRGVLPEVCGIPSPSCLGSLSIVTGCSQTCTARLILRLCAESEETATGSISQLCVFYVGGYLFPTGAGEHFLGHQCAAGRIYCQQLLCGGWGSRRAGMGVGGGPGGDSRNPLRPRTPGGWSRCQLPTVEAF